MCSPIFIRTWEAWNYNDDDGAVDTFYDDDSTIVDVFTEENGAGACPRYQKGFSFMADTIW